MRFFFGIRAVADSTVAAGRINAQLVQRTKLPNFLPDAIMFYSKAPRRPSPPVYIVREAVPYPKLIIFGRAALSRAVVGRGVARFIWIGGKCHDMQRHVTLHSLQTHQPADAYAVVNGHRISVDLPQSKVHFYRGERAWGKLVSSLPVEKWSGDWLIRSVGRFFRIPYRLDDNKAIASIQRNGYLTVQVVHRIGGATLHKRLLANTFWDYAIHYRDEVDFGTTVDEAVSRLREKLKERSQSEQAEITIRVGAGSRFTEHQLVEFCEANGLEPGGRYTKQFLRQTVLRQRKLNCLQFRDQLLYFGIGINCK